MSHGQTFKPDANDKRPFPHDLSELYGAVAEYYDAGWLSLRNALWHLAELQRYNLSWAMFMGQDKTHPSRLGHRIIADLLVYAMQEAGEVGRRVNRESCKSISGFWSITPAAAVHFLRPV